MIWVLPLTCQWTIRDEFTVFLLGKSDPITQLLCISPIPWDTSVMSVKDDYLNVTP